MKSLEPIVLSFVVGAVILGCAGLMWAGADVATRHDCYTLAQTLAAAAAGAYANSRFNQGKTTPEGNSTNG